MGSDRTKCLDIGLSAHLPTKTYRHQEKGLISSSLIDQMRLAALLYLLQWPLVFTCIYYCIIGRTLVTIHDMKASALALQSP